MFPDTDNRYKGVSSLTFLRRTAEVIRKKGYEIGNIDSNILAQRPKLLPYFPDMQAKIAEVLGVPANNVHVKAKTMEHLGIVGTEEAIAAEAVALVFLE
jgi:2-C-methyl-D-erythritol 2,4-cyclodiphosphate synthase